VRSEDGTIAGSALHIDQAVRNLMLYAGIPFESAIIHATRSPARLLGLDREMGTIEPGRRADIAVWSDEFQPLTTIVGGSIVHGAAHLFRPTRARA
jgi:N-acetylglucosamine-6-phosphate deacetylase